MEVSIAKIRCGIRCDERGFDAITRSQRGQVWPLALLVVFWVELESTRGSIRGLTPDGRERRTVPGMTTFEYALNVGLVGLVVLQIRGIRLTKAALLLPVVMTAWAASQILHAVPTGGNDVALEAIFGLSGVTLGAAAGLVTAAPSTRRTQGKTSSTPPCKPASWRWPVFRNPPLRRPCPTA
jgi:hypothetical protein